MPGKRVFSASEASQIKELLRQKANVGREAQKPIRRRMRELHFYITDFDQSYSGFTVADFDRLVKDKRITIE
jgi:hypothetical protein